MKYELCYFVVWRSTGVHFYFWVKDAAIYCMKVQDCRGKTEAVQHGETENREVRSILQTRLETTGMCCNYPPEEESVAKGPNILQSRHMHGQLQTTQTGSSCVFTMESTQEETFHTCAVVFSGHME